MSSGYAKDSFVVYGKMGVCRVMDRQTMTFGAAGSGEYYVLCPVSDSRSSVYVPCDNPELTGRLRPLLTARQIEDVLSGVSTEQQEWIDDRNTRQSVFRGILSAGDRQKQMRLIRCIYQKKQEKLAAGKRLSTMDETILQDAVRLVEEEFSLALDIPMSKVADYIQQRLDKK